MVRPIIKIHSNRGLLTFSVFCGRNFSRPILLQFYFSYLSIHILYKSWYLHVWRKSRYISLNFLVCSKFIYLLSGSSNSTTEAWHLFMDCGTWLTQRNFQFPTLVAAHQAEGRGPPVGRGPQVENRWSIGLPCCKCPRDASQVLQANRYFILAIVAFIWISFRWQNEKI